jgi:hypothetical protein
MPSLTAVDALLAVALAFWLRALMRARREDIPCTPHFFSWAMVGVGLLAIFGLVVANVLVLKMLDRAFGQSLSPLPSTTWLLTMSGAAILFIVAMTTFDTNRRAAAWIRLLPPDTLTVRTAGESIAFKLEPGAVRALGVAEGMGGMLYVQYLVRDRDRAIELVVPFTRDARAATSGTPPLGGLSGLVVQGGARKLHRYLAPFCAASAFP